MVNKVEHYRLKREMENFIFLKFGELSFEEYFDCHLQLKRIESAITNLDSNLSQIDLEIKTLNQLSQVTLNFFV